MRLILCDRQGNMLRDVAPILSCKRHENLDGTDALTFSTTVEVVKSQRVIMQDGMGRWHEYVVGTVTEGHDDDGSPISQVWAESAMAHDFRLSYIQDRRPTRLADALSAIAEATRWRVGTCDVAASDQLVMMYHVNAWEALGEVVKAHGGEVQARISPGGEHPEGDQWIRYLDFLAHRGSEAATRRFEWGHDIISIQRDVLSDDVVTAVWAWGKGEELETDGDGVAYGRRIGIADVTSDGLPYVHDDSLLAEWGLPGREGEPPRHRFGEIVEEDCTDPLELLAMANARLAECSVPRISYAATVAQFGVAGTDFTGVAIGDEVQVVDRGFATEIRTTARIVDLITDELDPSQTTVTLDTWGGDLAGDYAALSGSVRSINRRSAAWDAVKDSSSSFVEANIERLNELFASSGGFVTISPTEGITVMDASTFEAATSAIQINGAGFRLANTKTAGGEWNWRTFGTGDGMTLDELIAGILRAGRIESFDGSSWWDLDDGTMQIGVATQVGPTSGRHIGITSGGLTLYGNDGQPAVNLVVEYTRDAHGTIKPGLRIIGSNCSLTLSPATTDGVFSGGYTAEAAEFLATGRLDSEGDLEVSGNAQISGTLDVDGAATFDGAVRLNSTVDVVGIARLNGAAYHNNAAVYLDSDNLQAGGYDATDGNAALWFRDFADVVMGKIQPRTLANGAVSMEIFARRRNAADTANVYNGINLQINSNDEAVVSVHHPKAWRDGLDAQQNGLIKFVDTTTNIAAGTTIAPGGNAYASFTCPSGYVPLCVISLSNAAAETRMNYTLVKHADSNTTYVRVYNCTSASVTCSGYGVRVYCIRDADL